MSNKYVYKLTPKALGDLEAIYNYIAQDLANPKASEALADKMEHAFALLEDFPKRCPYSDILELKRDGYRKCVIDNYVALYTVDEKRSLVIITRIFYGAMDYKYLI